MTDTPRQDLKARAFAFGAAILDRYTRLAAGGLERAHMAEQLFRAATGIGALLEEAEVANSRRDMAAKQAIALRESREANFRLRMFARVPEWSEELAPFVDERRQFVAMLTPSVRKLRSPPLSLTFFLFLSSSFCPLPSALCPS